jgi:UDPglucose 6-dehydrogenase
MISRRICVIGLWHQGIVGAACLADFGYSVIAADHDAQKIETLKLGKAPLYEPDLDDLIQQDLLRGRLTFTVDVAGAVRGISDVWLMFDTPVNELDESDLTEIFSTVKEIAPNLEPDTIIVVTAQVPIGTCDEIVAVIRDCRPGLKFSVAYMPENLRLGQAIERFKKPPLPVIGSDDMAALDRLERLLGPFGAKWEHVSLCMAEMTKHALNGFLAMSITFANELGNLCDEVGADGHRLAEILRLEPRIGPKAMLYPGLGFSGGTLARDLQTLRSLGDQYRVDTPMLDGVQASNQAQNGMVVRRLKGIFGDKLNGHHIAVLGLTYKPDTSTLRRSAALEVISGLVRAGASVAASDPRADRNELKALTTFEFFEDPYDAVEGADALVLMTPWKQYKELDFEDIKARMGRPVVFDTANLWSANDLIQHGIEYFDIGRGRRSRKTG